MISEEAVEVMRLSITKQAKRIIKGLGGVTTVSKGTCTLSLVARNGDRKTVPNKVKLKQQSLVISLSKT
jgi:hypothetical protein